MMNTWVLSALWVGLALIATLIAIWFRVSTALSEIVVGTISLLIIGAAFARSILLCGQYCHCERGHSDHRSEHILSAAVTCFRTEAADTHQGTRYRNLLSLNQSRRTCSAHPNQASL
jgi:hypothetical protein